MVWAQIVDNFTKPPAPSKYREVKQEIPPTHKQCTDCKEVLLMKNFYHRPGRNSRVARCKTCYCKAQSERYNIIKKSREISND